MANTKYQGAALGNLGGGFYQHARSTSSSTNGSSVLIARWPVAPTGKSPARCSSAAPRTRRQSRLRGRLLLSRRVGRVALRNNSTITNMFIVNGDGTYGVKFQQRRAKRLRDRRLLSAHQRQLQVSLTSMPAGPGPTTIDQRAVGRLAEKAYAQLNEFGWSRAGFAGQRQELLRRISGGYIYAAHVTARSLAHGRHDHSARTVRANYSFTTFVNAYNAGKLIGFASYSTPPPAAASSVAMPTRSWATTRAIRRSPSYNPWGLNNGSAPGTVTMSWSQIQQSFPYFDRTASKAGLSCVIAVCGPIRRLRLPLSVSPHSVSTSFRRPPWCRCSHR